MNTKYKKNYNFSQLMLVVMIILSRFLVAFLLAMLPFITELKGDWYVMPLLGFNFVCQFGLAIYQMLPYFKQLSKLSQNYH